MVLDDKFVPAGLIGGEPLYVDCPACNNEVMIEGLEPDELVVCPHCDQFFAGYNVWEQLQYINIFEIED